MNRLLSFDPRSSEFFRIAERLYDEGNYLYAVVAAQTAFELHMEGSFAYVLEARGSQGISDAVGGLIGRRYGLSNQEVRGVWKAFTGHTLTEDARTWEAYQAHLKRRNELVHRGEQAAKEEAAASLYAVNALAAQVTDVVLGLMPTTTSPTPDGT